MSKILFSFLSVCFFSLARTFAVFIGGSLLVIYWLAIIIMESFSRLSNKREIK